MAINASDRLPVASAIKPRMFGPTMPPRTPNELMVAIAVAAATPENMLIGNVQSGGIADNNPAVATDKPTSIRTGWVLIELKTNPNADASMQNMT